MLVKHWVSIWPHITYFLKDFSAYIVITFIGLIILPVATYKIFRTSLTEKSKKILIVCLFTIFIISVTFSICELYFRYFYDVPDGLGFLKVSEKWQQRHVIRTSFNGVQFRDIDFDAKIKNQSAIKIGVIGDSITFGGGIENPKDRFSDILSEKLKKDGYNVEVYNLGIPGYDSEAEIEIYKRVSYLNFDILIWQYFLNDIQSEGKSTGTPIIEKNRQKTKIIQFFSDRSYFFDYLYWRISAKHNQTIRELRNADFANYRDSQKLAHHKQEIADFVKSQKDNNKEIITVIFPSLYFIGPNYPAYDIHQIMEPYFRDQGVQTIDLLDYLKDKKSKDLIASSFDSHPNEYVHELTAEKLFDAIKILIGN